MLQQTQIYKPPFYKTVNIFSDILNKKLLLKFGPTPPKTDGKVIYLPNSLGDYPLVENQRDLYTLLEHELAHIVFETDMRGQLQLLTEFPDIPETVKAVYNLVEDHRCESCYGLIYAGSKLEFNKLKKKIIDREATTPIDVLGAVRAERYELIPDEQKELAQEFRNYLKEVECKGSAAGIAVSRKILNRIKDFVIEKQFKMQQEQQVEQEQEGQQEQGAQGEQGKAGEQKKEQKKSSGQTEINDEIEKQTENSATKILVEDEITTRAPKEGKTYEETMKKAEQRVEKIIREIEEKMKIEIKEQSSEANIIGNIIKQDVYGKVWEHIELDKESIRQLRAIFRRIKGKAKVAESEEGIDIDLDNYIQRKAGQRDAKVFQEEELGTGLNIVFLLDCSGSMGIGARLKTAKKILLTLLDATKNLWGVNVEVYAYSGSDMNKYHTPVVKLTRDRLFTLDTAIAYKFTHTHTAVHYVSNILAQKQGKKLLCILTDGYPENKSGDDLITFTSIAVWKARQRGIKVFAVLVARKIKQEWMHQMYGKESEWVVVEDFEHAGKVLINVIGKKIAGMMYGN